MSQIVIIIVLVLIIVIVSLAAWSNHHESLQAKEEAANLREEVAELENEIERRNMVEDLLAMAGVRSSNARKFCESYILLLMTQNDTDNRHHARQTQRILREKYSVQKNGDLSEAISADLKRFERR